MENSVEGGGRGGGNGMGPVKEALLELKWDNLNELVAEQPPCLTNYDGDWGVFWVGGAAVDGYLPPSLERSGVSEPSFRRTEDHA